MQQLRATLEDYWIKAISDDLKPTGEELAKRFIVSTPMFFIGGALGTQLANVFTYTPIRAIDGALLGAGFVIINTLTNMACKVLNIQLKEGSPQLKIKLIVDIALAALLTMGIAYIDKVPISLRSMSILIPSVLWGAMSVWLGSHLIEAYITNIARINQNLRDVIEDFSNLKF